MEKEHNHLINKIKSLPQSPLPELTKQRILSVIKEPKSRKKRFLNRLKIIGVSVITLMIALILINPIALWNSSQTIIDDDTPQELPIVSSISADEFIVDWRADNMDRGQHDFWGNLVVTPLRVTDEIKRGDVVFFTVPELLSHKHLTPGEQSLSRIIALPGETIKIEKGQVYIDGKKLVAFYGNEYHTGYLVENSKVQLEETKLAEDEFFVLGDNWWRSVDSKFFGPLHRENIIGKITKQKSSSFSTEKKALTS